MRSLPNRCRFACASFIVLNTLRAAFEAIYRSFETSKIRPVKGWIQVVKIVLFIIGRIGYMYLDYRVKKAKSGDESGIFFIQRSVGGFAERG